MNNEQLIYGFVISYKLQKKDAYTDTTCYNIAS